MSAPTINASPTKEFFIRIITKDISLIDAIKDLIDNCVDGARAIRGSGDYSGLSVHLEVTPRSFAIVDNCGGISVDTAVNYAFRFGRAKGAPALDGSIGQFGVGMKRALFKMGKNFEVKSTAADSKFILKVDVEKWTSLTDEDGRDKWELEFDEVEQNASFPESERGTTLVVTDLYPGVSAEFGTNVFVQQLIRSVSQAHAYAMDSGLDIQINNFQLRHPIASLLQSDVIKPIKIERLFDIDDGEKKSAVKLTIYAGLAESSLRDAGWYIICNSRLIVGADKSELTGWATELDASQGGSTPAAHGQFSRFRGYAVFESDNAKVLPWNTAKSNVDVESKAYQAGRMEMAQALRQVVDFLNSVDAERDTESTFLRDAIDSAKPVPLTKVVASSRFVVPQRQAVVRSKPTLRVQYQADVADIDFAKEYFEVNSATKAGEATLSYFLKREREE